MPIELDSRPSPERWARALAPQHTIRGTILAAGLGSRLEPLTKHHIPKPLFPLGGKVPIVEMWVRKMIEAGIADVTMNVCVLAETIKAHFEGGARLGVKLGFVDEKIPTGTLGGVCKQALGREAKRVYGGEPIADVAPAAGSTVLAPSADIVTNFDAAMLEEMFALHRQKGAAITMVVNPIPPERRADFGTVILEGVENRTGELSAVGRIVDFAEKDPNSPSNLNNASIYLIENELLRVLDDLRTEASLDVEHPFYDFGKQVFPALLGRLDHVALGTEYPMFAVRCEGGWFDVGTKRDYLTVTEYFLDGKIQGPASYAPTPWGQLGDQVDADFGRITVIPPVVIGNRCRIEPGATLGPYAVIGDGWHIAENAAVRRSVLWDASTPGARDYPSELAPGVTVDRCIVAGGRVDADTTEATIRPLPGGGVEVLPLDHGRGGPRV